MTPRTMRALAAVFVAVLLLMAAVVAAADPNIFVYAYPGPPDSFDPGYSYNLDTPNFVAPCYDNLLMYDGDSLTRFLPMLAREVPTVANGLVSSDGTTVRFPIRHAVRFHNGDILTPADVEYTFERIMLTDAENGLADLLLEPLTGARSMAELVRKLGAPEAGDDLAGVPPSVLRRAFDAVDQSVEVQGERVIFRLARPYAPLLQFLSQSGTWGSIVNKSWLIYQGGWDGRPDTWIKWYRWPMEDSPLARRAMGTGPFILEDWDGRDDRIVYRRFEDYWRGPARLAGAVIRLCEDEGERVRLLREGQVDAAFLEQPSGESLRAHPGIIFADNLPLIGNRVLCFNWDVASPKYLGSGCLDGEGIPPDFFADPHVRKGFRAAFDYGLFRAKARIKTTIPVGPTPAVLPYVDTFQAPAGRKVEVAVAELQQAFDGRLWENGFKLTLPTYPSANGRIEAEQALKTGVEALNPKFKIEFTTTNAPTYRAETFASTLPLINNGWTLDYPHADCFYAAYMHSAGWYGSAQGQAYREFARREIDPLVERAAGEWDPARAQPLYHVLQRMYRDYALGIPYMETLTCRTHRSWLKGFSYSPARINAYDFYALWKEGD